MSGFHWDQFYVLFKEKLEQSADCTVGRYMVPEETDFPYVDIFIKENIGGNYDLEGGEGSQNPLLEVTVYGSGTSGDSICYRISEEVKKLMLSYGFQCRSAPVKTESTAVDRVQWTGRYQRIFADGDELVQWN